MDALAPFSLATKAWFGATFREPTAAQAEGWQSISSGNHTLILAPTGSGKTLAAFLWAIDRLVTQPEPIDASKRLRVLYVSPLKSLTYDVERNLRSPLTGIELESRRQQAAFTSLRIATRTGDTSQRERRDIVRHPPDVLITTPESLYLMLTSSAQDVLASVEAVVVDEIHAMAPTKRGAHMALSLERLEAVVRKARGPKARVQRIGLSATQRPLEEVARFLGGRERDVSGEWRERPVSIVNAGVRKQLDLTVVVPVEDMSELGKPIQSEDDLVTSGHGTGSQQVNSSIWPAIYPKLLELIRTHTSTLVFVNSRRLAERLANKLNELAAEQDGVDTGAGPVPELVRSHHGSIAREQRLEIEDMLKAGKLPALVATSSLELGIDMGAIDLVVQVEAPTSVASGLQRIGRAGHQVGAPSKGTIFPKFRGDLVLAAVSSQRMQAGLIEHTEVPRNPLDVLAQQIVAMVAVPPAGSTLSVDDVADMVGGAYPFGELSRDALHNVLDMLAGRYPSEEFAELRPRLVWDRVTGILTPRAGARMLAVTSGGTIPDRGLFGVFTPEGGRVGELDEEMVYESRVGETFLLGATTWKIIEITRDRVVVIPAPGEIGKMPFWHGDSIGRPYELGQAVGAFLRTLDDVTDAQLAEDAGLDELAIRNLRQYVREERESTGGVLPTDQQIVVERFRDELGDWRVAILSPFGAQVHAPWALAIETNMRDRDIEVQAIWSDDGIVLRLPEADDAPPVEAVLLDPEDVEKIVVEQVGRSPLFAARFRENAARALLLPRRRPGSRTPLWQMRQRAADLLGVASRYGEFPILLETYRECLRDVFDLPALVRLMHDIRSRAVRVTSVDTQTPSPFASSLVFSYVANFMYEGDAPLAERRAQALALDRRMLAELIGGDELRDLLDVRALERTELEMQALTDDRRATSLDTAHDLLRRLGDLSAQELRARTTEDFADALVRERRAIVVRVASEERYIAIEDAARYRDGLGTALPVGVPDAFLVEIPDAATQLLRRYARTHGPFVTEEPALRLGLPMSPTQVTLDGLLADGRLVRGEFRPGGFDREWCDVEVLRIIRQRSLAALRKEIEPAEPDAMVRFLPVWQGVGSDGGGLDQLYDTIARLQGVAIPASILERDVLAPRVRNYSARLLDELMATGEIMWTGGGPLGRSDGKVRLFLRDQAAALLARWPLVGVDRPDSADHQRIRSALEERGACFFRELVASSSERETLTALWDLAWAGEVTNDGYNPVRAAAQGSASARSTARRRPRPSRISALGPPMSQGRWSLVEASVGLQPSPTMAATVLVNLLLQRHGVLTREAVRGEGIAGGFAGIYPVLRAMEEAGKIRRGYFVTGLGGAQFALAGAVDRLRDFRETTPKPLSPTVVLAATDPANPFGVSLAWPEKGAQRVTDAFVVLIDGSLSLYVEKGGKGVQAFRPFDGSWEEDAMAGLLTLLGARLKRLRLERFPVELEPMLKEAGFVPTPRGLVRYP